MPKDELALHILIAASLTNPSEPGRGVASPPAPPEVSSQQRSKGGGIMATCERCGNEPGSPYTFLYGTSETNSTSPNTSVTTKSLKGVETAFLGERCIRRRKRRTWIWLAVSLAIILAAGLMFFLGVESGEQTMVFGVPVVVVGLIGIAAAISALLAGIMLAVYRDPTEAGIAEAQQLRQKELKRRGFNYTVSPSSWIAEKSLEPFGGSLPNRKADREEYRALKKEYEAKVPLLIEAAREGKVDLAALQNLR